MRKSRLTILVCLGALVLAPALMADTITIDGAVFSLSYTHLTGNSYLFDYSINTTGYTGPGHLLHSVAVNPSGANILAGSFTGPTGWTSAPGNQQGPGGCGGSAGNYWCAQAGSSASMLAVPGGTYNFFFTLKLASPLANLDDAHIQASFGDMTCSGRHCNGLTYKNQLGISTGLSSNVPEPASLVLFGSGLIAVGSLARRKLLS